MKIAVLILAAGKSSRMGGIKQLLPYKNSTILGTIIENVESVFLSDIYVILGANSEKIAKSLKNYSVHILENDKYASGLSSSIKKGVEMLVDYDAILILLGDQPRIDAAYIQKLQRAFLKDSKRIVASSYHKIAGVPAIFPKTYFKELVKLEGDKGAKDFLNSPLQNINTIEFSEKLIDIDTPEDYKKLMNL
jgi:molybdenum cofactor cytidylyltransferase